MEAGEESEEEIEEIEAEIEAEMVEVLANTGGETAPSTRSLEISDLIHSAHKKL